MKKIILLIFILPFFVNAQIKSCCRSSSTEQFAQFASNDKFASAHLAPVPFNFVPDIGTMISLPCSDGTNASAFEIKSTTPSDKWLFVFHEWWGLNDYIKKEAQEFNEIFPNVNIIAVDLYDGEVADKPEQAQEIMGRMKDSRCQAIINGVIKHIGNKAKIATIGWCMGGGWSLQASLIAGKQAIGCVMYYGMPENNVERLKKLNCEVLGIFASKDEWINKEVVGNFEKNMKSAGKKLTYKWFNASHAFANPSNPAYDNEAKEEAGKLTIEFLTERFK